MQIMHPTPIQLEAIPLGMKGHDLIGIAQTGTGKTLAFGLPMLHRMSPNGVGLVLVPTRELAVQVEETLRKLGAKCAVLIGGAPMNKQVKQLSQKPRVIVATPGRLADHLQQGTANLRNIEVAVLDEADRMLDMGFIGPIRDILRHTPKERQTMLFSATFPETVETLAEQFLFEPLRVEVERESSVTPLVTQEVVVLQKDDKPEMLSRIIACERGTILVFTRTRHGARKTAKFIRSLGHSAGELHSDRTLPQRLAAMRGFKSGELRILVATDIAARGVDVKELALVLNYDVPECAEDYVHRIGRTGRAGATGHAITLLSPEQNKEMRDIERLTGERIPVSKDSLADLPPERNRGGNGSPRSTSVPAPAHPGPRKKHFNRFGNGAKRRPSF